MRSMIFGIVAALLVLSLFVLRSSRTQANPQQPVSAAAAFLATVDVDGDGVHTYGDRAVMEWWVAHGGDIGVAMAAAQSVDGVQNVRAFLASPAAQLDR